MRFVWPSLLWLMFLVPALALGYFKLRKRVSLHPSLYIGPKSSHIPAMLFLVGFALVLCSISRPEFDTTSLLNQRTLIFAIDVSGSMVAGDIPPNRLGAVKEAVKLFIEDMPSSTSIGIVPFSDDAILAIAPTTDKHLVRSTLDSLVADSATAIGRSILVSLEVIFPGHKFGSQPDPKPGVPIQAKPKPVSKASYTSAAIILFSDGQSTTGITPMDAAKFALERGVRIFTISVGTNQSGPEGAPATVDEASLKEISELTGGEYYKVINKESITDIAKKLDKSFVLRRHWIEMTVWFVGAAFLFLLVSVSMSLYRRGLVF